MILAHCGAPNHNRIASRNSQTRLSDRRDYHPSGGPAGCSYLAHTCSCRWPVSCLSGPDGSFFGERTLTVEGAGCPGEGPGVHWLPISVTPADPPAR